MMHCCYNLIVLFRIVFLNTLLLLIIGCSPVKIAVTNQYQLSSFASKYRSVKPTNITLLVTSPEAAAGYQTEKMLYINKPFQLESFTKNAWISPPGDMLYSILVQSIQHTGYFFAVTTSPYSEGAAYRLDTQLLVLDQNFLKKPSVLEFSAKVVLTHINDNHVVASRIFNQVVPCPSDTPYGGVIAANKAVGLFTESVAEFVINGTRHA
jgi:cholesterol transport system auxiliary component